MMSYVYVNYTPTYDALQSRYKELPWHKTIGLWLIAPMLAWYLFGSHQRPTMTRINQFITWVNASWFFQGAFGDICNVRVATQYAIEVDEKNFTVHCKVAQFAESRTHFSSMNRWHKGVTKIPRNYEVTKNLLLAVAYGMESEESNIPVGEGYKDISAKPLFKPALYAKDLLVKSPEFLLERAHLRDWGGRTFKGRVTNEHPDGMGITAFEYALWAKDFKMLEMMLSCIPATKEGDSIRAGLLKQYEQVTAPIEDRGGLTYELTYDRPTQDTEGIPIKDAKGWQTTSIPEVHTENHFNLNPLLNAYEDYNTHFNTRTRLQRDAYWIKVIGTQQRLLPIHILQRYFDRDIPFSPLPSFMGNFKRFTQFYNYGNGRLESLLSSSLAADFSLFRGGVRLGSGMGAGLRAAFDLAAVRQMDEVSTNEIEKIKRLLAASGESPTQFRL